MAMRLLGKAKTRSGIRDDAYRMMVEEMPVSVMTCDLEDFTITYANRS